MRYLQDYPTFEEADHLERMVHDRHMAGIIHDLMVACTLEGQGSIDNEEQIYYQWWAKELEKLKLAWEFDYQ